MKRYETELPQEYAVAKTIDAGNKKVGIIFNLIALAVMALTMVGAFLAVEVDFKAVFGISGLIRLVIFFVVLISYVILHELVHGAVYKILTRQKLKFGFNFSVAFCGVPHIYVYRTTALIAVLAPFVVFLPIFTALPFVVPNAIDKILLSFLWGMHAGGCVGDLYVAGLLLFRFRDSFTLMNDTGPKQTFYLPKTDIVSSEETASENDVGAEKDMGVEKETGAENAAKPEPQKEETIQTTTAIPQQKKDTQPKNKKKKKQGKKK